MADTTMRMREMMLLLKLALDGSSPEASPAPEPIGTDDHGLSESLRAGLDVEIHPMEGGPFSVANILDLQDVGFLQGRSLRQVFLDPGVATGNLLKLKDLGKMFLAPGFPSKMKLLGRAVYFLSSAAAMVHGGEEISSLRPDEFRDGIRHLIKAGLEADLQYLCREALARMTRQSKG